MKKCHFIWLIAGKDGRLHRSWWPLEKSRHMLQPITGDRGAISYSRVRSVRMCIEISTHPAHHPPRSYWPFAGSFGTRPINSSVFASPDDAAGQRNTSTLGCRAALTRARGSQLPRDSITAYQHRTNWTTRSPFDQLKSYKGTQREKECVGRWDRKGQREATDRRGTIDRLAYVPRFNQSLLKTLSPA